MATSWRDNEPHDSNPSSGDGSPTAAPRRQRLQLKPRSAGAAASTGEHKSGKSNPFGAAKPRELVLASKGIDPSTIDAKVAKKSVVKHYTKEQEREIEAVRAELTKFEAELREANENELPEESYRLKAEEKRKELNALMAKCAKENEEQQPASSETKFERPSERRKRLEQQGGRDGEKGGDSYSSFGGNRHRDEGGF